MDHNFQPYDDPKVAKGRKRWWCQKCDSIVEYPDTMDTRMINRLLANKLLCISPEEGAGKLTN